MTDWQQPGGTRRPRRRRNRRTRLWAALLIAAVSAALPGLAHLWAGRRWAALLLFGGSVATAGSVAAVVVWRRDDLIRLAVQPRWLIAVAGAAVLLALAWAMIVLRSYLLLRPAELTPARRVAGRLGVFVLCLAVCAPFLVVARYAYVQHDLVTNVFAGGSGNTRQTPGSDGNPWEGMDRLNILLLGSDAHRERYGVRTDSIHLASIDPETGRTVLISLPRNLEDVPFPPGPLRQRFPNGFDGLLFGIYQYAVENPDVAPQVPDRGAELLKQTVGGILGMPVHYYAMVDLNGFQKMVDAMGGVHLCVERPIPYGYRGKVVQAGCRTLTGSEALWYGRSRTMSSDYDRMERQRCLIGAMARQADPITVLRHYQGIASAVKQIFRTDVPQYLLPDLLDLGMEVKGAQITSLQFVPPLISPAYPDYPRIRRLAHRAIERSEQAGRPTPAEPSARPRLSGEGPVPPPGQPPVAQPQPNPQQANPTQPPPPAAVSLQSACNRPPS